jgi:hypothetical protein
MAITLSFAGQLNVTDSVSGTVALSKQLTNLSTAGTAFSEAQTLSVGTGGTTVSLPISPTNFLYVKNLHATNTLLVTWTPASGTSAQIVTLQPGAFIAFSEPTGAAGITALTLTGSASATLVEYVLGG